MGKSGQEKGIDKQCTWHGWLQKEDALSVMQQDRAVLLLAFLI
jgi:hypothetical protein